MKPNSYKIIGILFLIAIATSCKSETKNKLIEKTYPVVIEEYSLNKFHHSDSTTLTIRKNDSIRIHLFGLESNKEYETIMGYFFEINTEDNSIILVNEIPAKLIGEKEYSIKNEKLLVRKYLYSIKNVSDEDGYFFVLNNRIIAFNSTAWTLYKFYKYENSIIDKLLINDTTDFFNHQHIKISN